MKAGILTLFPELFDTFLSTSLVGRAVTNGQLDVFREPLRNHGLGAHRSVDDTPYGGGAGMVLRVDCLVNGMEAIEAAIGPCHRVLLTPQGTPFTQRVAERWAALPSLLFVCGRYEGYDERVRSFVHEEASLGDFVLTGAEVAVMAMLETCVRLLPGVLGNQDSAREESFSREQQGGLEYPQYTRPNEFRGVEVPAVLKTGHHDKVRLWRQEQSRARTQVRRPDLLLQPQGLLEIHEQLLMKTADEN